MIVVLVELIWLESLYEDAEGQHETEKVVHLAVHVVAVPQRHTALCTRCRVRLDILLIYPSCFGKEWGLFHFRLDSPVGSLQTWLHVQLLVKLCHLALTWLGSFLTV